MVLWRKRMGERGVDRIYKCPECESRNIITDSKHAELYCADCGLVIAENIVDLGPEWRSYDEEQTAKRIRTGPPMTYRIPDKGLGTPAPELPARTKRLRWISIDSGDKTLVLALLEIDRMTDALKLPNNIKEETSVLYRKAMKHNLIKKGRSIEDLVSAMLYITCRQYEVPRTLKEIAEVSRSSLKKIRRAYIFLIRKLGIKLAPVNPARYIPRFCSKLGLSEEIRERAIEILRDDEGTGVAKGWEPTGTAAAAIYLATVLSGEKRKKTELELAKVAGVSVPTIRSRLKFLERQRGS